MTTVFCGCRSRSLIWENDQVSGTQCVKSTNFFQLQKLSSFSIFLIRTEFEYLHHKSSAHFIKGETSSITFKHCDYTNVSPCLLLEFFCRAIRTKKARIQNGDQITGLVQVRKIQKCIPCYSYISTFLFSCLMISHALQFRYSTRLIIDTWPNLET